MDITLKNRMRPRGRVELPPSKSEAIRAALLYGLAGADPEKAVEGFSAPLCRDAAAAIEAARHFECADCGESAALLRMMIPIQAVLFGRVSVCAEETLIGRGLWELEECLGISLAAHGGRIEAEADIRLKSVFTIDCSRSSQFLSGLLIALPLMDRECEIIIKNGLVSRPYAEMTLDFVRLFGGRVSRTERGFITRPSAYAAPERTPVTGDASYAAVFEAMDLLGAEVEVLGKSAASRQPDAGFLSLAGLDECDITDCPDLAPLLAAAACAGTGAAVIRGTARLKTKESDRESGTAELIRALGGSAEAGDGRITVYGTGALSGGAVDPLGDHRLCFAAAVMSLICRGPVCIKNAECVAKSAPGFWDELARLTE